MKIQLDQVRCEGHGMCEQLAPKFFSVDDDGVLTVLEADVAPEEEKAVQGAVRGCPVAALRLLP